jgi:uncharacterized membrane protein
MSTVMQWLHLMAAVVGLGGLGFLLLVLMPSLGVLSDEKREELSQAVAGRFRWASWSAIVVLLISGLYNIRRYYWEDPWDRAWKLLTLKLVLSFAMFAIFLGLTIPLRVLERVRARRKAWLIAGFSLGVAVVLISAYLRRG